MTEEIKVNDVQELNDQMLVRREKMESMREHGLDPFGTKFESYLNQDLVEHKSQTDKAIDVARNVIEYYQEREEQNGKDGYGESFGTVTDRF